VLNAEDMGTPALQLTLLLTTSQMVKINKRFKEKKRANTYVKKADVVREIVEAGLQALDDAR
jgi:hypothetical protein